ncbi:pyridoxal phosphate-dependent aminotransferase [Fumia xinanensis]|uniref:histidinol-phosphate transaminase n=1 Tax=Fumia xinanensis TaxID=2763659 RepID=A0A926E770_9FIRM|nr:histidinol-phosphate transaminase [Fumia xinanensis]MBC8560725.1 histidinol-phosphate aminotransferase family protein [Fumia xinanensis]
MKNQSFFDKYQKYNHLVPYKAPTTSTNSLRLHLNENLFGPSKKCLEILKDIGKNDLSQYDLKEYDELVREISDKFEFHEDNIFIHNGSCEIIRTIFTMNATEQDCIMLPSPGWGYYQSIAKCIGANIRYYNIEEEKETYVFNIREIIDMAKKFNPKILVVTTPNMPTGNIISYSCLETLINACKDTLILVDEAYWGFSEELLPINYFVENYSNVVFVRTFSKLYGLANERIGYCVCNRELNKIFSLSLPLFRVSSISRKMAKAALEDSEYYDEIRNEIIKAREYFIRTINKNPYLIAFQSQSNFVYIKVKNIDGEKLKDYLNSQGYLVRSYNGLQNYLRITIYNFEVMNDVIRSIFDYIDNTKKYSTCFQLNSI